ncbi:High-affinity glucose transporter [Lasiodiplodia hormozganensis]|uniref:High-affinity glucose transporter n=1 Tax=Lasiodiplodia hormozganensis TaxID=869390 RepID=A0AA39YX40_9PEZI|nr:High-affinity glucose transporter [Lasiodiplodia hormozganensis]
MVKPMSNIYALAGFGTIGGALFGFDISSMSAWIGTEQYAEYFNHPSSDLQGGITASMSAGSFVGALGAGFLSDRLGRKRAMEIAAVIWIIGSAIQCSAQNVAQLIVGRIINGFTVGIMSSQVPVYLAELSPGRIRGRVVGIQQWAIEWGILIMYLISYGCSKVDGPASFRIAWGVQGIPAFILLGALFFFPESPRWLASKDRWEESLNVLALLHGKGDPQHPVAQAEYLEVREAVRIAQESKELTVLGLFGPKMWRRTVAGTFVQLWQQLLGGNVMMYYIVYVFNMAGLTGNVNLYSSAIQYVIFLVTTGFTLLFIEKVGRRQLLIYGAILMSALNFAVAGIMAEHGNPVDGVGENTNIKWQVLGHPAKGIIACSYIFVGVYGLTWAPAAWIYCSEVFPLRWRAKGVGLSAATNWIFNFALAYFVPPAFENIVWRTYIIFGVFCFASTIHVFLAFPETAGKTLEEIDAVFEPGVKAWKTGNMKSNFSEKVAAVQSKGLDANELVHSESAVVDEKGAVVKSDTVV